MILLTLQSVEEDGCRRAYDSALEVYKSAFQRPKDPEEVSCALCLNCC